MRLVAESVMDQTFGLVVSLVTGVPAPDVVRRAVDDALAMRDFLGTRGWFNDPTTYHRTPDAPTQVTLDEKTAWVSTRPLRYQHLAYESGYEPHPGEPGRARWLAHEQNATFHAYVLEHPGPPRPWLVCVHGFGMGTPVVNLGGFDIHRLHEELGLNVLLPCLPYHGPRSANRMSGGELLQPDYLNVIHMFAQAVWDIRRSIAWLRHRGAEQIGLYGLSLGGYNVSLVSAMEQDLACVIAGIPAVDFVSLAQDNEPWLFRRYHDEFPTDWDVLRAITHVVSPLAFSPQIPVDRRFIFAGTADRVARPVQARALWRHWERPRIHWFSGGHVLGVMNRSVRTFVGECLREARLVGGS